MMMVITGVPFRTMIFFFFFFFFFMFFAVFSDVAVCQDGCSASERCGGAGPVIRFPFRLKGQPDHCGYPGFELSCSEKNETLLELPNSVRVQVRSIIYDSHQMSLQDPENCLPRQLQNLSLADSPFSFNLSSPWESLYNYTFFNCSSGKKKDAYYVDHIPCLSLPDYPVYAVISDAGFREVDLSSCRKMYSIKGVPYQVSEISRVFSLKWSEDICRNCEESMKCRLKTNSNQTATECIGEPATGAARKHVIAGPVLGFFLLLVALTVL